MNNRTQYIGLVLALLILVLAASLPASNSDYFSDLEWHTPMSPPDSINPDSTKLKYPFTDYSTFGEDGTAGKSGLYMHDPPNIQRDVVYDPITGQYTVRETIGGIDYRPPTQMSLEEYRAYDEKQSLNNYWRQKSLNSVAGSSDGIIPSIYVGGAVFDKIFGGNTIDIRPQGSVELIFGVKSSMVDDPNRNVKQRRTTNFDFQEKIQMNVVAKVGDKIEFKVNYDTEATFDFENKLALKYEGKEDEIIKLIEAGDVTLPLNSQLIQGSQSLFGVKTKLQFGNTVVTAVFSKQESESSTIVVEGGAQKNSFLLEADDYEENKHFFISQYFVNNYDTAMSELPLILSAVNITKMEVWITNIGSADDENRNLVAMTDLGEVDPYNSRIDYNMSWGSDYPDNDANDLISDENGNMSLLDKGQMRDINSVSNYLKSSAAFNMVAGRDFEKIESARKLESTEYSYNSALGFISLYSTLNSNQSLAVSFQYTIVGNDKVYQVGEFSDGGIAAPSCLIVKLLRGTSINTNLPIWDLMMKNVYSLNAYQVNSDDFILNILYSGSENGVPTGYFDFGPEGVKGTSLIEVMGFDRLNANGDTLPDGIFDFIDQAAINGGTIQASNGRLFFTTREPFGADLRKKFGPDYEAEADGVAYDSLYSMTKTGAQQYPDKNKFLIEGYYKSSSGSDISLNALNVPQGSVTVTAGGRQLQENVDYTVDYTLGRVKIINEALLSSGTPINISLESNSMFSVQTKTYMGMHVDQLVNDNLTIGATIINLRERPLTTKTNLGDDPVNNTMWGFNFDYQQESRWLTKMVDAIPLVETKAASTINFSGEFAQFIPGHSKAIGDEGTSYIDDFEGATTTIDLKTAATSEWFLASVPQGQQQLFPSGNEVGTGSLRSGFNRAKMAWYIIDPLFYDRNGSLVPENVTKDELSENSVRQVLENEVFPNKELSNAESTNIPVLNLAFYPKERGPNNYVVDEIPGVAEGLNSDGTLVNPTSRWGGVMRRIEQSDFEENNVEYIEFWIMDPWADSENPETENGGDLYIHLGDISEDILPDSRKSFENGLPSDGSLDNTIDSEWGRIPTVQDLTGSFSTEANSRQYQDVGYDGVSTTDERTFFKDYIDGIESSLSSGSQAYINAFEDPSADDYHYFRGDDYDTDLAYSTILSKYKKFNNAEGNSPDNTDANPNYSTTATRNPNVEDIDGDNTLWEDERYFQYKVSLRPEMMQQVGENNIADIYTAANIPLANGEYGSVKWYQFKVPINQPESKVGSITDWSSIRFMRMVLKGFDKPVVVRFASLDLVRAEWRRYKYNLLAPGEYVPDDRDNNFAISTVNIEENGYRTPIPYVLPPDIDREINYSSLDYTQMNEQSMQLTVDGLQDGDARAVYKTTAFDFRQYQYLKMFVHAEDKVQSLPNDYGDLTIFIRMGSDFTENYYEYEIPLAMTPWYTSSTDDDEIWPDQNAFDIDLERLVSFKVLRNTLMRDPSSGINLNSLWSTYDGLNKVTVRGTPTISDVGALMIGIRNPKKQAPSDPDDGEDKSAIIWVDELRLTDFINQSGWAATARIRADLADLGNFEVAGYMNTPGFGSIEQGANERSLETNKNIDVATNLAMGKFFPEDWGVNIPVHFDYSSQLATPDYNPLDPDVKMETELDTWETDAQRDSIKSISDDRIKRVNLNVLNVRKERINLDKKAQFWDVENWDISYAFSSTDIHSIDVKTDRTTTHDGGIGYNYSIRPKEVKPFGKSQALGNKWFSLIKDFNFFYLPKSFTFRTDMYKEFQEKELRQVSIGTIIIQPTYYKDWTWTRNYNLQWDLAKSLKFTYSANAASYINELPGSFDEDGDYTREENRDAVMTSLGDFGEMDLYNQDVSLNYKVPLDKIPLIDWITANAKYQGGYIWEANTRALQEKLGNSIENSNTISINGTLKFTSLYNKLPYLKKLNSKRKKNSRSRSFGPPGATRPGANAAKKDTTKSDGPSIARKVMDGFFKTLMMVKDANFQYSENRGMLMPGFAPEPTLFGMTSSAPGWPFVLGWADDDFPDQAIDKGWISNSTSQNQSFSTKFGTNLSAKATIEPFRDFRIDLTASRTYSENYQAYYVAVYDSVAQEVVWQEDSPGNYTAYTPQNQGHFSITTIMINTAFKSTDANTLASDIFDQMVDNRSIISARLADQNANSDGAYYDPLDSVFNSQFRDGYGPTSAEVLQYAFLAAYQDKDATKIDLKAFPTIPLPNWRITYKGLTKFPAIKKKFKSITLQHAYTSTYNVGNYSSNVLYEEASGDPSGLDDIGNFIGQNSMSQVVLAEQFSPLIGINMSMKNNFTFDFQMKKSRSYALSFTNNQLTEQTSNDWVFGMGYRFKNIPFIFKTGVGSGKRIESDLNVKADVSISDKKTIMRMMDTGIDQISQGSNMVSIGVSADYKVSKSLSLRLFYDQTLNNPYLANQFDRSTVNAGVSIRFSLAQ